MQPFDFTYWIDVVVGSMGSAVPVALSILLGIAIFIVGWLLSKTADRLVQSGSTRAKLPAELGRFFGGMARYAVLAATVIAALDRVGVETTSLLAVFASAGLAIGLALQGSLANFAAGVMILFFRPFAMGDKITAGGHTGVVEDIGLFATTLSTPDNERIIVPNGGIMGGSITNISAQGTLRGAVNIGVAYGTDLETAMAVCLEAVKGSECVLAEPAPAVAFVNFGASSLDLVAFGWCESADYLTMLHNMRVALYDALNEAGIEIPFDQVVMHQAPAEAPAA